VINNGRCSQWAQLGGKNENIFPTHLNKVRESSRAQNHFYSQRGNEDGGREAEAITEPNRGSFSVCEKSPVNVFLQKTKCYYVQGGGNFPPYSSGYCNEVLLFVHLLSASIGCPTVRMQENQGPRTCPAMAGRMERETTLNKQKKQYREEGAPRASGEGNLRGKKKTFVGKGAWWRADKPRRVHVQ